MNNFDLIDIAFTALERRKSSLPSSDGQHGRKPALSGAQQELSEEGPHTGIGTADAGSLPVYRYWTVKIEARGSIRYVHVQACDAWKATTVALKCNSCAISAQVVREIDREEFEHLTRVPT